MSDNYVLKIYNKFKKLPFGQWLFSRYAARRAPYFKTIKPLVTHIAENHCEVLIKKHKAVTNHIGTIHVIAICNGLEMAMGFMAEASIPKHLRWIPKGMTVDYTAKAETDIVCRVKIPAELWQPGDMLVPVEAVDSQGSVVVKGAITLWITEKGAKK
ncbi:thioesterase [Neiella marina]|uniref:Thioesterase n=1 Tax=Neiella marina TaxID=508461 RepID=A0A8J2U288_9GAMM|nr:hotdog fold domain-containing protein [Neiella marina]GGA64984.1 thioesterase [Neiella marina]